MSAETARTARELQMLEGLVDSAYELALVLSAAAKGQAETEPSLDFLDGYLKCSLAIRMGIRLCMALRAPPKAAPEGVETERAEAPERDPAEPRERDERERERDYEPVSLPKFLSTLGVVARDAQRLGDRLPAEAARVLPTLQGLLARAKADPPPASTPAPASMAGVAVLTRPPQPATRHRLLGSAAPPRPGPRAPPRWPNPG